MPDDKTENQYREELIRKYKLAGRIRFVSFFLLLLFLILMKYIGGYSYLNNTFISLIFVEAMLNQPYDFLLKRANLYRFQFYQMATDIIAISWIVHFMGGLEAPIVSIAYYAVILWAGLVSTTTAVFFAVITSALFFSLIVILGHVGLLPSVSYYNYKMPIAQMYSLLLGNIAFLFAFGYFSAYSSKVIKLMQRKRQEESLRNAHKLLATGSLVGKTAHDVLNQLAAIRGYAEILLGKPTQDSQDKEMLESILKFQIKSADLVKRLALFSRKDEKEFTQVDIHKVIDEALDVCWPMVRYSHMEINKKYDTGMANTMANSGQLQEAFVVFIINAMDAISKEGVLTIQTSYFKEKGMIEIKFSDTGIGIKPDDLKRLGEPFFTTKGQGKGLGLGLATAYGIINRHNGNISVESKLGKGTVFSISLPVKQ
jgi:signal transduction histidine kinase